MCAEVHSSLLCSTEYITVHLSIFLLINFGLFAVCPYKPCCGEFSCPHLLFEVLPSIHMDSREFHIVL